MQKKIKTCQTFLPKILMLASSCTWSSLKSTPKPGGAMPSFRRRFKTPHFLTKMYHQFCCKFDIRLWRQEIRCKQRNNPPVSLESSPKKNWSMKINGWMWDDSFLFGAKFGLFWGKTTNFLPQSWFSEQKQNPHRTRFLYGRKGNAFLFNVEGLVLGNVPLELASRRRWMGRDQQMICTVVQ